MTPDYYYYLNQSDTYKVDGTDDRSDFSETLVSTCCHFSPQKPSCVTNRETKARRGTGTCLRSHSKKKKSQERGPGVRTVPPPSPPLPRMSVL